MIDVKHVEAFYWTIRLGTQAKAADRLHVTQSAINKRLQELDRNSCSAVYDHSHTKYSLTEKGRELYEASSEMIDALGQLYELRGEASHVARVIRIGVTEYVSVMWLSDFIKNISAAYPELHIHPEVDLSKSLQAKLLAGELDLVFIPEEYITSDMESVRIQSIPLSWLSSKNYPGASQIKNVVQLSKHPIIVQSPESGLTERCERAFAEAGVELKKIYGSNSIFAVLGAVKAGLGISCVPVDLVNLHFKGDDFLVVDITPPANDLNMCLAFLRQGQSAIGYALAGVAKRCIS